MLPVLLACTTPATDDSGTGDSGIADTATADDSGTGDSGIGLLALIGTATVGEAYAGTEQIRFAPTTGGDPLCVIDVPLSSVSVRTDCTDCLWAFDLTFGTPTVTVGAHCEAAGYDAATIAAIAGSQRSCGFAEEYLGHAEALLVFQDGAWEAVSFADWSLETGALSYAWEQGYQDY
ncbi:MAG: hypothetical protein ACI8RZ_002874 [Myxococcota bacterium]|jgi:hypothetical protein